MNRPLFPLREQAIFRYIRVFAQHTKRRRRIYPCYFHPPTDEDTDQNFNALQMAVRSLVRTGRSGETATDPAPTDETRLLLRLRKDDTPRFCELLEGLRPSGQRVAGRYTPQAAVATPTEVFACSQSGQMICFCKFRLRSYGNDGEMVWLSCIDATEFKAL